MDNLAIRVEDVCKVYKLYDKPSDRLKDALGLVRKNHFKEHHALKHVSFEVKKGETIGIIGTNGSGKSTILKIITGVLSPTSGEVEIDGRISALLELGAGFNMEYTGIENVYLNGMMMGFSREEMDARLDDILKFADIGDFVHQPCKTYSSGMFVRLAWMRHYRSEMYFFRQNVIKSLRISRRRERPSCSSATISAVWQNIVTVSSYSIKEINWQREMPRI